MSLACLFNNWIRFSRKTSCLFCVDRSSSFLWASYLATLLWKKGDEDYFSTNFVYVLRTTTTHHMVSFIDFHYHFLAHCSLYLPHCVTSRVSQSEPGLPMKIVIVNTLTWVFLNLSWFSHSNLKSSYIILKCQKKTVVVEFLTHPSQGWLIYGRSPWAPDMVRFFSEQNR